MRTPPRIPPFPGKRSAYRPVVDSGMVSAYQPADRRKEQYRGFFGRVQQIWDRAFRRHTSQETTEQGSSGAASPSSYQLSLWQLRYDRRNVITDCREMYEDDPRTFKAVNKFAHEAVRGGCVIAVNTTGRGKTGRVARIAREEAERLQKIINAEVASWARMMLVEGEEFIQAIVSGDEIVDMKRMPTSSMERLTNDADEFDDPVHAFAQIDVLTNAEVATFPLFSIWHGRWNHIDGERYGNPEIKTGRRMRRMLELSEEAQVRRRMARAAQRRLWVIGDKDNPAGWEQVQRFKTENGFVEGERDMLDPMEVGRDFFGNGLVDAKDLDGDPNVHHVDDIRYYQNVYAVALPTPAPIYNLDAESVNRDVLEDQRAEWLKETQILSGLMTEMVDWAYSLALLLKGILPETISYTVRWSESSIETPDAIITRTTKARQNTIGAGHNAEPDPLISKRRAVQSVAEFFDIDDVDEELAELESEAQERQYQNQQQQQAMPGVAPSRSSLGQVPGQSIIPISLPNQLSRNGAVVGMSGGKNGSNGFNGRNGSNGRNGNGQGNGHGKGAGRGGLTAPYNSEYGEAPNTPNTQD